MLDINSYHWGWYLLGLLFAPKLTFMIFLSIYVKSIPLPLMIMGWIIAIGGLCSYKERPNND